MPNNNNTITDAILILGFLVQDNSQSYFAYITLLGGASNKYQDREVSR